MSRDRYGIEKRESSIQNSAWLLAEADERASRTKHEAEWRKEIKRLKAVVRARVPLHELVERGTGDHARVLAAIAETGSHMHLDWCPAKRDLQNGDCFTHYHGGELTVKGLVLLSMLGGK